MDDERPMEDQTLRLGFFTDRMRQLFSWPEPLPSLKWLRHLAYNHYLGSSKLRSTWWWKLLVLWVISWLVASLCILCFMSSQAAEKRSETLAAMCEERARMLQDQFNVSMNHLQALAILVSTFHHSKVQSAIDQATFAKYAERTAFERPLTSGVAYAVRVPHRDRVAFEMAQGWAIKKMYSAKETATQGGGMAYETQEVAEEYAPVIFAQDAYKHVISFDMLTGDEDRENILRARESGKGVLTAPFRLLNNRLGVILTYAVYKADLPSSASPADRVQAAIGYLGGIFDVEALVDKLLHQLAGKRSIIVEVYDTTDGKVCMYCSNVTGTGVYHVSMLNFGDPMRKHEMHCSFTQKPPLPWLAITTSFGTLVIALLIGHIFHATVSRITKVEDDYRDMMELKRRAEAADVAKSQFLATVSHEIRTPMNGVLGMLQMLIDTNLDTTQQDYVRTAQASGKALVSLINEVLDQAKIESGKLELESVPFDLRTVLDDVLSLFCGKAQEKGIELAVYVSERVPDVLIGDPGRMRQIITNLMGNSIKFTERGHIFVTVHLIEEVMTTASPELEMEVGTLSGFLVADKSRSWEHFELFSRESRGTTAATLVSSASESIGLIVSVEDTGVGIPYEAQSRIFTPFMQVGPSVARIHGGTGIGLSISKCLVGLMKGEIGFVSKPHVGSTFTFTVVLSSSWSIVNEKRPTGFEGMRSLVIDHRPVRLKVAKYHLQRLGIHVEAIADLNQALQKVSECDSMAKLVLIDGETWLKEMATLPASTAALLRTNRSDAPRLFLMENPTNSIRSSIARSSKEFNLNIIMKPLRASMLQVSLRRAMGVGDRGEQLPRGGGGGGGSSSSFLGSLLHRKQILVVDDNMVNLKVAAGALRKYGAEVTCADSGKKAIGLLKPPHNFDACFMDIQMPEMDGFEATRRIRMLEDKLNDGGEVCSAEQATTITQRRPWHTPILAMTADVIQATYEECLRSGMDGYVSKPFEAEQLYREVARFLDSQEQSATQSE